MNDSFLPIIKQIETKELEKYRDGEVFCFQGTDCIKAGSELITVESILTWEGFEEEFSKLPQEELEIVHTFSGGVYIREMHIPKGIFILGKRHRHETCNILLKGTLSVYLGDGKPVVKVTGPLVMTSDPMVRKIAYCHKDTVFLNIHPTQETDIGKIEDEFIITEQEYLGIEGGNLWLGEQ